MTISPATNGFIKGLVLVVIGAIVAYLGDSANLTPVVGNSIALLIAAIASAIESSIKAQSGAGLFGAVRVK